MTTLYELSVGSYRRVLQVSIGVMDKAAGFFAEQGVDMGEVLEMRLAQDMLPFSFQVNSIRHHSLGSVRGLLAGEFLPPPDIPELDYQGLKRLLTEALTELDSVTEQDIAGVEGKAVLFKASAFELPFTTENFVLSFSLPNLYFHTSIMYAMLRIKGAPLGKLDFMGEMKIGLPET